LGSGDFETTDNAVVVTVKNKQLKVHSAVDAIATVLVYDLSGRQLYKKERLNNNEVTVQYITSGTQALVVKVVLENGKIVTKKVIY
jgi:myo-inositol-hexaphosphate 3-phosphohydrolase